MNILLVQNVLERDMVQQNAEKSIETTAGKITERLFINKT